MIPGHTGFRSMRVGELFMGLHFNLLAFHKLANRFHGIELKLQE